ncbi:E3 ubiquitin/ISG15 ligase TRIM25-like [Patagioenas fasciata]|uniref:E3 ubiquitin/ISG15 ligase TRIM25-like n=1 Tax=Patagioenas fasciata TaxID=372321 RepID=UPI0032E8AC29
MAKEFRGGASLKAELSCPICLSLYKNPVLLRCGHSFCNECIQKTLSAQQQSKGTYSCPMCNAQLDPTLELQKNFQLCNIVKVFQPTASEGQQDEGSAEGKEEVVPCDYCLDQSQPAVKTCLSCDASLCQAHLNKHNAKASQQDHILVGVGAGGGAAERRCPEHGKLLECFCQYEEQHICVLCSIAGRHKGHSIVTLKEAHSKQLGTLSIIMARLQEDKNALITALKELQRSENQVKTNTKIATALLQKQFEEMKTAMIQKEKKILSDIESIEKKQLADITEVKKKMEEKRDEAEKHLQSLQKMREEPDLFLFFKEFKVANDRAARRDFSIDTMDVVVQLNKARINQYQQWIQNLMSQLDQYLQRMKNELTNQIRRRRI